MSTLFVVDASVAVKWLVTTEALVTEAQELLASQEATLIAPDLIRIEVANTLRRLTNQKDLTAAQALERFELFEKLRLRIRQSAVHLKVAYDIALQAPRRSVQDSLYLALALSEGARLITADDKFFRTLEGTVYETHAVFLGTGV